MYIVFIAIFNDEYLCIYMYIYLPMYLLYIYIYIYYSGEKTTPLSKKYFHIMSSTILLQLNFHLQRCMYIYTLHYTTI